MSKKEHEHHASPASEQAMRENDAHTRKTNSHDAVPGDDVAHAHSHAAHLVEDQKDTKTKPEGNLRQGSEPGARREPPMDIGRIGKDHRKQ